MSVKPEDKILTYQQVRELKWFSDNVTGLHLEYYKLLDQVNAFNEKMKRLQNTCKSIENYAKENELWRQNENKEN